MDRPYREAIERLKAAELRPTRQRLALCRLLFAGGHKHVTAEALHDEAVRLGVRVSLATVYNTLHQFTHVGILRQVVVDGTKTYFDTNTCDHHHFFREADGVLMDIPGETVTVAGLPASPPGTQITRVDVVVRLVESTDESPTSD